MNKKIISLLLVLLCLFVALPAFCEGGEEVVGSTTNPVTSISTKTAKSAKVLATVNLIKEKQITQDDVDSYMQAYVEAGNDASAVDEATIIEYLAERELLHQAYAKAGYVDNDFNMSEDTINGILNYYIYILSTVGINFATVDEFNAYIEENNFDIAEIINYYAEDYLFELYLEDHYSDLLTNIPSPTEEDVSGFYAQNKDVFTNSEKVSIAHILFLVSDEAQRATVKKQADDVYSQIKNGKLTFEKAVSTYSKDSDSVQNGGLLGWVNKQETAFESDLLGMTPDMYSEYHKQLFGESTFNKLFNYDDGEITTVLESPFGYHIFKILNHQATKNLTLNDRVYPTETLTLHDFLLNYLIPQLLVEDAQNNAVNQMYSDLLSQATITY